MSSMANYIPSRSSSNQRAFYTVPDNKPTASRIIRESREWLQAVSTQRPFTPMSKIRSLFSQPFYNDVVSRPVSSIKMSCNDFDQLDTINARKSPGYKTESTWRSDQTRTTSIQLIGAKVQRRTPDAAEKPSTNSTLVGRQGQTSGDIMQSNSSELHLRGTKAKILTVNVPKLKSPSLQVPLSTEASDERSRFNFDRFGYRPVSNVPTIRVGLRSGDSDTEPTGGTELGTENSKAPVPVTKLSEKYLFSPACNSTSSISESPSPCFPPLRPSRSATGSRLHRGLIIPTRRPATNSACTLSAGSINTKETESAKLDSNLITRKINSGGLPSERSPIPVGLHFPQIKSAKNGHSKVPSGTELNYIVTNLLAMTNCPLPHRTDKDKEPQFSPKEDMQHIQLDSPRVHEPTLSRMTEPTEDVIIHRVNCLLVTLRQCQSQNTPDELQRALMLQCLFVLMDNASDRLQLMLIGAILTLGVSGSKLANVCKLLYKVTKDSSNDDLFVENPDILEIICDRLVCSQLPADAFSKCPSEWPETEQEALLFICGSLKFLATSPAVGAVLVAKPALTRGLLYSHRSAEEWLRLPHSQNTEAAVAEGERREQLEERLYSIMLQITEVLCHLSTLTELRSQLLIPGGVMDHIIDCLIYRSNKCNIQNVAVSTISPPLPKSTQYLVYFNWIRLLARLTESAETCRRLTGWCGTQSPTSNERFQCTTHARGRIECLCKALTTVFEWFPDEQTVVVRAAYLLGNLCARTEEAREALIPDQSAMRAMLALCQRYRQSTVHKEVATERTTETPHDAVGLAWYSSRIGDIHLEDETCIDFKKTECNEVESSRMPASTPQYHTEVLVKMMRIIANATINENVGQLAVMDTDCLDFLLKLIAEESRCSSCELLLNCLAGLNNITYYITAESPQEVVARQYTIAEVLLRNVLPGNTNLDAVLGCVRVFGNLSRQVYIRNWLMYQGGTILLETVGTNALISSDDRTKLEMDLECAFLRFIMQNLDSARPELVYSTLGVLINLMTDGEQRPIFRRLEGLTRILNILRDFAGHDWQLAGLACKTLWNYTETRDDSISQLIPSETLNELHVYLSELTDENVVSRLHHSIIAETAAEVDNVELWQTVWSTEFLPVARELLHRISHS